MFQMKSWLLSRNCLMLTLSYNKINKTKFKISHVTLPNHSNSSTKPKTCIYLHTSFFPFLNSNSRLDGTRLAEICFVDGADCAVGGVL